MSCMITKAKTDSKAVDFWGMMPGCKHRCTTTHINSFSLMHALSEAVELDWGRYRSFLLFA